MTNSPVDLEGVGGPIDEVCRQVLAATTTLLGSTIRYSEDDWSVASACPGWSRAHVAAHLSWNAQQLCSALDGLGARSPAIPDAIETDTQIQLGSTRDSLALQIDLDTSADQVAVAIHDLTVARLEERVRLPCRTTVPARLVPLVRLCEVILHHWDMRDGYTLDDVDADPVLWCLELRSRLMVGDTRFPAIRVIAHEGLDVTLGRPGRPELARGDARSLLGWLTGRGTTASRARWGELPTR